MELRRAGRIFVINAAMDGFLRVGGSGELAGVTGLSGGVNVSLTGADGSPVTAGGGPFSSAFEAGLRDRGGVSAVSTGCRLLPRSWSRGRMKYMTDATTMKVAK